MQMLDSKRASQNSDAYDQSPAPEQPMQPSESNIAEEDIPF